MSRKTLKRKKTGCPASGEAPPFGRQQFRVVFIWMSGPLRDPTGRVLLVGTTGARAVYEGVKPWSKCKRWIHRFLDTTIPEDEFTLVCKTFMRTQFATIQVAQASLEDLAFLGLHRADR
jgi:hypothetical protein